MYFKVAGYKTYKPLRWTRLAKECYERGGVCDGCSHQEYGCVAKGAMILSVVLFGKPKDVVRKDILKE